MARFEVHDSNLIVAYWQHDAACRVIARLKMEKDEVMSLLAQAERQMPMSAPSATTINASGLSNGKRGLCIIYF